MIEFMLIAAPRSGTTWAANWLTTDATLCLHDPSWTHHYTELDSIKSNKILGISETMLCAFPDWVNRHPARKVILHRPVDEINESLAGMGLPPIQQNHYDLLERIDGEHYSWTDLFDDPRKIYEHLTELSFDEERHKFLCEIQMQPAFERLTVNKAAIMRIVEELRSN
jgi:hypothetical protein